ncbi:metal-sensitive transcriptional regulator [Deinococcus aquaticus]|uniref:Metal-sensitive transcriptional regulator n=1 Tax=Deinococcus aquaticus TaxID=328692 RepID=A0ABY7V732_9DEIO|nr:metal-sensitive transcriptional regulator [Deinococcus aquaticus]WDA60444.1 metal-sensitive transcriptional regulator [Deinococcus aquaticus]
MTTDTTPNPQTPPAAAPPLTETDTRVLLRLRRIEGQVRGLQRMIEEGRDCHDILTQLSGVRSALDAAGEQILEQYAGGCRARPGETITPQDVVRAVKLLRR